MSLFEYFGERHDPGPIGGFEVGGAELQDRPAWARVFRLLLSAAFVIGAWILLRRALPEAHYLWLSFTGGALAYLALGFYVRPRADTSNLGWAGGLFDHPFRYSDDINRWLLFLSIVLWPGRFVAVTGVETVQWMTGTGTAAAPTPVGDRPAPDPNRPRPKVTTARRK